MTPLRRPVLLATGLLVVALAAAGQEQISWHTVRPGESLEIISAQYLGSAQRWREIRQLNPDIQNPNHLVPGQRLRVSTAASGPIPAARLQKLSSKVEDLPLPFAWRPATFGDLLIENDGLRTFRRSSAEIRFLDGTSLVATEDSLVFLRGAKPQAQRQAKTIEIVRGHADLEARASGPRRAEVEILLGKVRALAAATGTQSGKSRARRPDEGGAKLMIYEGEGEVEAAGAKVEVPRGMGSSVPEAGPPSPPEPLLPAPEPAEPPAGAERFCSNPPLRWEPVPQAASYVVEVCRDTACAELVERATGLTATEWRPAELPQAALFWRATAVSATGLDGYPSEARPLTVAGSVADTAPPEGTLEVTGDRVERSGTAFVEERARVEERAEDSGSGIGRILWTVNGKTAEAPGNGPLPGGPYRVEATAEDRCGNSAPLGSQEVTVDAEAPVLHWEVREKTPGGGRRGGWRGIERLEWSRARPRWLLWAWQDSTWRDSVSEPRPDGMGKPLPVSWRLVKDRPEVVLIANRPQPLRDSAPVQLGGGQELRIWAEDAGCGLETFLVRQLPPPEGPGLRIEATDCFGHLRQLVLPLAKD